MIPPLYQPYQPTLAPLGLTGLGLSLVSGPASASLTGIVHSYIQISASKPTPYPMIPDGTQAIFISPQGAFIGGAQSQARELKLLAAGDYFGIRLYPAALRHFFSLSLSEISDQFVDEQYLPCRQFGRLHQDIYRWDSFAQRAAVCESWLLNHFARQAGSRFDQALALIYQSLGNIRVEQLATTVGWSSRHLNRLFRQHTGLSTKTFAQTIRIQQVCRQLAQQPDGSLDAASELGFFDQAHLLNDYKKRLSASPGQFLQRFRSDFYNS